MTALDSGPRAPRRGMMARLLGLAGDTRFHAWAARFSLTRPFVRREGEAIFDLVSGFVQSQALRAIVELDILETCLAPATASEIAARSDLTVERAGLLLRAGVAMGLLSLKGGHFRTTTRGAALAAVPGLTAMISHHDVLYRDLANPVAFLRGQTDPELARFWPYVFGGGAAPGEAQRYSRLMSDSQSTVAEETLAQIDLGGVQRLMDVGGGTGVFLSHALDATTGLKATLLDLAPVLDAVPDALRARLDLSPGSFRDGPLPRGADAISLVRVLYDHDDRTVLDLLSKIHAALPEGGRLIVSEPMTGGAKPHRPGDVYFAFYCAAMGTGTARSQDRISDLIREAGFNSISAHRPNRAFITSVIEARK